MKPVILKGGKKEIIDVDHVIFFYMKKKKYLEILNPEAENNRNITTNFPVMYVSLRSKKYRDSFELFYPFPKDAIKEMDKLIEDYKKKKISKEAHSNFLNGLMYHFITRHLKNGIYKKSNIKINLLKNTKLYFVNSEAYKEKDIINYFKKFYKLTLKYL